MLNKYVDTDEDWLAAAVSVVTVSFRAGGNPCHDPGTGEFCETDGGEEGVDYTEVGQQTYELPEKELWKSGGSEKIAKASLKSPLTEEEDLAFGDYSTSGYEITNPSLRRGGDGGSLKAETTGMTGRELVQHMDAALNRASLSQKIEGYRAIDQRVYNKIEDAIGGTVNDKAYTSITTTPGSMLDLHEGDRLVHVVLPKGSRALPIAHLSDNEDENEVITGRGSVFKVSRGGPMGLLTLTLQSARVIKSWAEIKAAALAALGRAGGGNPCHDPGTGQFCETDGDGKGEAGRVWTGRRQDTKIRLSQLESGHTGERIAQQYLKDEYDATNVRKLGEGQTNYPVDIAGDHVVVEVKTGQVSNAKSGLYWAAKIGQPGKKETAKLKTMSPAAKARHNAKKYAKIMRDKEEAHKTVEKETGMKLKKKTIGIIINPDTKTADMFEFDGFHRYIGWNSPQAKAGYKKTIKYK